MEIVFKQEWLDQPPALQSPTQMTAPADLAPGLTADNPHESPTQDPGLQQDAAVDSLPQTPVRAALAASRGMTGQGVLSARQMAQELNIPEALAADLPDRALEELYARKISAHPPLAAWAAQSRPNAALVRENAGPLLAVAQTLADFDDDLPDNSGTEAAIAARANAMPQAQLWQTRQSAAQRLAEAAGVEGVHQLGDSMANAFLGLVEGYAAHLRKSIAASPQLDRQEDTSPILPFLDELAARYRKKMQAAQAQRPAPLPPATSAVQRYAEDVARMAPQIAGQVLASALHPAAGLVFMSAQIGGQTYGDLTEQSVDPDTALVSALGNAVIQAPLEQLSLQKALSIFKTSGIWNTIKAVAGAAGTEFLTEWAQQYPDEIAHIWAESTQKGQNFAQGFGQFMDSLGETTMEGLYQGAVATPWGALLGGAGMLKNGRRSQPAPEIPAELAEVFKAQAAEADAMLQRQVLGQALQAAATQADAMPAAAQDAAAAAEMLEQTLPQAVRQTWIGPDDAATLYQHATQQSDDNAQALLQALGTDAAGLRQATDQGAPLPVSTAKALTLPGDLRDKTLEALRAAPQGVSGAEAAQYNPAARAQAALAEARSAQRVRADVNKEATRITGEIIAAGYPAHTARTYVQLMASHAQAMQAAYNLPADMTMRRISVGKGQAADVQQQGQQRYQLDNNGNAVAPGEATPRIASVVAVDPSIIVDAHGQAINLKDTAALRQWVKARYQGRTIRIKDDGKIAGFFGQGLEASGKKRGKRQRQAYAGLDTALGNALHADFEAADPRHPNVRGQNVYYAAVKIGQGYYAVRFKLDVQNHEAVQHYKDHKVTAIEMASVLHADSPQQGNASKEAPDAASTKASSLPGSTAFAGTARKETAIRGISLSVLNGSVKASRLEGNTLYQQQSQAPLGSVTFTPEHDVVRIFKGANLSTVPHEAAHIFLQNLMRVAHDDGTLAVRDLRERAAQALQTVPEDLRNAVLPQVEAALRNPPERLQNALRLLAAHLRDQAGTAKAEAKALDTLATQQREQDAEAEGINTRPWQATRMQHYAAEAHASALGRVARQADAALRYLHGQDQARVDLRALRRWAGLVEEGDLALQDHTTLHEATARGFEQYLMEGKAPSKELSGVFSRLRAWLLKIYQAAREALGVPITDDVRRVFDRMLATDRQIKQNAQLQNALQVEQEFLNSGHLQWDEWEELNAMRSQAEQEIQAAMDRSALRGRNARYKQYYEAARHDLQSAPFWQMIDEVAARRRSDTGVSLGGLNKEDVVRHLGKDQAAELSRARPGIVNAQGTGMPLDLVAMEQGYDDADQFITAVYDALVVRQESRKSLAAALAEQRLAEDDMQAESDGQEAAGDAYAAYLDKVDAVVLRMAARKGYRTKEEQDRFVRNAITPRHIIQGRAWEELMHTPLRDITPERYRAMLDKALRDRSKALVDGDVMAAVRAVDNARLANDLIWGAQHQFRLRDALLHLARETANAKPGTFPTVHREALRKLLERYDLAHMRGQPDAVLRLAGLRQVVEQTLPDDVVDTLPSFADWVLDGQHPNTGKPLPGGRISWRDLTPSQLHDVDNLLKYLRKTGYDARTDAQNSESAKVRLLAEQSAAQMSLLDDMPTAPTGTRRRAAQDILRGMSAGVDSLRWQIRKADGLVNTMGEAEPGPLEAAGFQAVRRGEQGVRARIEAVSAAMAPHLVHLAASSKQWEQTYGVHLRLKNADGSDVVLPKSLQDAYRKKHWTADMVLALALNMGNASNMARVVAGYGNELTYDTVAELLGDQMAARLFSAAADRPTSPRGNRQGLLTVQDWQAVQGIWDALATQWADTQAVHERMYGFRPAGVEPQPITLLDPQSGQPMQLAGGYYPVRYDPQISDRVAAWGEREDILSRNESLFAVPSAKKGHTQARTDRAPGLPVRLDTAIIVEHIQDAVRFIELGEIVRRLDRVTQNPLFRAEYIRTYGRADYDAIRPNLRGLVRNEPPPKSDLVATLANKTRKYLVPWGLSWNLKVAALQMTAIFPGMGDLGARPVLRGMGYMARHGMTALRQIWEASPYMRSRIDNLDQDLQRNIANFSPSKRPASVTVAGHEISYEDAVNVGMLPIVAVDAAATAGVWIGAYTKMLAQLQGGNVRYGVQTESDYHQQAVDYADSTVSQSNPDYAASSRSGFIRAQNTYRLVNNFASAVTLLAARHHFIYTARAKGKISLGRLARFELYETLLPAAAMFLFLALARGYWADKDDSKEALTTLALSTFADQYSVRVPMFGSAVSSGITAFFGDEPGYRQGGVRTALDVPFELGQRAASRGGKALFQGVEGEQQAQAMVSTAFDVISFAARIPVSKLVRAGQRGYEQWQRGEGTPLSIVFPRPGK